MSGIDLKPGWRALPRGIAGFTLLLTAVLLVVRAAAMLGPAPWRPLFLLMCLSMIALPWLLLSPHGRFQIGLKRPAGLRWLLIGPLAGAAAAALCFGLGMLLYGSGPQHWFVSVAHSYGGHPVAGMSLLQLHLMFTIAACLFSPIGEEIFFRGFLQRVFEQRLTHSQATHLQAWLFGVAHLCHHGIVATSAGLVLMPLSAALWVLLMFALSWLFAWLRRRADSLYPAMLGHAAFNAAMNSFIFGWLWPQ